LLAPEPRFDSIEAGLWILDLTRFLDANRSPLARNAPAQGSDQGWCRRLALSRIAGGRAGIAFPHCSGQDRAHQCWWWFAIASSGMDRTQRWRAVAFVRNPTLSILEGRKQSHGRRSIGWSRNVHCEAAA